MKTKTKSKPKTSKSKKKDGFSFLDVIMFISKIIFYILITPYLIVKFFVDFFKVMKTKKERIEKKKKRDSIKSIYEAFEILEKKSGSYNVWEDSIHQSKVGIILGARGKGKSAIGVKILENVKATTKKKIYAMGFNSEDVPGWINVATDIKQIKSNAFVLIDEGGILFSSRKSMTNANQILTDLVLISRHKNLSILFISQNSSNLDVNIIRQADYLILKPSSLLQKDFERKKIKEVYDEVKDGFNKYKKNKGLTYIYSEEFQGFVNNPLPSFWTINISKSFK